jgi:hypothetical protein
MGEVGMDINDHHEEIIAGADIRSLKASTKVNKRMGVKNDALIRRTDESIHGSKHWQRNQVQMTKVKKMLSYLE